MYYVPNHEPPSREPRRDASQTNQRSTESPAPERSMLERECFFPSGWWCTHGTTTEAWHTVMTYDPLIDSDDESQDENIQLEYSAIDSSDNQVRVNVDTSAARRLSVLSRLRGRPPTPEPAFEDIPLGRFQQVQSWD